jgi:hypothetical protein
MSDRQAAFRDPLALHEVLARNAAGVPTPAA